MSCIMSEGVNQSGIMALRLGISGEGDSMNGN